MNAREVLELIITGDGRSAIVEFERVGSAAKRNLDETDKSLDQLGRRATAFGIGALTAGAAASAMLFGASKAAGQTATDIGRVEGAFGSASAAAIDFVKNSNDIGLSDQVAAAYVAQIGDLAVGMKLAKDEAANFTVQSVDLLTQLSLIKGVDPGEGLDALASGLIGEYDALQRLVPTISAAAIEQRALAESGKSSAKELTGAEKAAATFGIVIDSATEAIGRAGGVQETLAVRNARVAATWGDIKVQIGEGALPVMEQAAGAAEWVADAMQSADEKTGGWATRLVTVAAVGTAAAGGLSLIAGQGINAYQAISGMSGKMRDAEGNITKTGRAARVTATSLGVLAGIGIIQIGLQFANSAAGFDQELADEVNAIIAATGDAEAQLESFADGVIVEAKKLSLGDGPKLLASQLGILDQAMLAIPGAEHLQPLADVQAAFDDLAAKSPADAGAVLDAYERFTAGLDHNSREYQSNTAFIDKNRTSLGLAAAAQDALGAAAGGAAGDQKELTDELGKQATAAQAALEPFMKLADAQDKLRDAEKKLIEIADGKAIVKAQRDVADAYRGVEDAVRGVDDAERGVVDARRRVDDATRNLSDAQRELNELLSDDPLFGMTQVSPEDQIADARNRLAEANRRLLADPMDGSALTVRDDALADLERATQRRQDIARDGDQRAKDIENARRRVEDAERNLGDAHRGVDDSERALSDARRAVVDAQLAVADAQAVLAEVQSQHGLNSEAYATAAREVVDAALDVQVADAELADSMREQGSAAVTEMIEALDQLIARGGPVAEAAAAMKTELEAMLGSLNIDEPVSGMTSTMAGFTEWLFGLSPTVEVDADTQPASDAVSWWQWGTESTTATVTVDADTSPAMARLGDFFRAAANPMMMLLDTVANIPGGSRLGPQSGLPGGRDGDPRTTYHSGGTVTGAARGQEIDIRALGGEGIVDLPGMDFLGPGGIEAINAGRIPDRFSEPDPASASAASLRNLRPRVQPIPQLAGSARGIAAGGDQSSAGGAGGQGGVTISADVTMVTPDPRTSGVEVVEELRRIAHRSGRGLAVDAALGR